MEKEKVVVIVPTYNESLVIQNTIIRIFESVRAVRDKVVEVLIFDSNSSDDTEALVLKMMKTYPLLRLRVESKKSGLGSAYLQAMHYAIHVLEADIVVEFDADLSHQPKYLVAMFRLMREYDVVVGSRYVKAGSIPSNWAWYRKGLSVLGNYLARVTLSWKYKDFTSGFKVTRASVLKSVLPKQFISPHYAYKLELLWLLHKANARITEYPIAFIDRTHGYSKLPSNSIVDALYVLGRLRLRDMQRYLKMCMVGASGFAIQLVVYNALRTMLGPFSAAQLAISVAICSNFSLNRRFTFKQRGSKGIRKGLGSLGVFILYSLSMIVLQSYWLEVGVRIFGSGVTIENEILILGMLLGSILNYLVYSRLIWAPVPTASPRL